MPRVNRPPTRIPNTPTEQGGTTVGIPQPTQQALRDTGNAFTNWLEATHNFTINSLAWAGLSPEEKEGIFAEFKASVPGAYYSTKLKRWISTTDPQYDLAEAAAYYTSSYAPPKIGSVLSGPGEFPAPKGIGSETRPQEEVSVGGVQQPTDDTQTAAFGQPWAGWVEVNDEATARQVLTTTPPFELVQGTDLDTGAPAFFALQEDGSYKRATAQQVNQYRAWQRNVSDAQDFLDSLPGEEPISDELVQAILGVSQDTKGSLERLQSALSKTNVSLEEAIRLGDFVSAQRLSTQRDRIQSDLARLQILQMQVGLLATLAQNPYLLNFMGAIGGLNDLFAAAGIDFGQFQKTMMAGIPQQFLEREPNMQQLASMSGQQRMSLLSYWSSKLGVPPDEVMRRWYQAAPGGASRATQFQTL